LGKLLFVNSRSHGVCVLPKRLIIRRVLSLSIENLPAGTFWD